MVSVDWNKFFHVLIINDIWKFFRSPLWIIAVVFIIIGVIPELAYLYFGIKGSGVFALWNNNYAVFGWIVLAVAIYLVPGLLYYKFGYHEEQEGWTEEQIKAWHRMRHTQTPLYGKMLDMLGFYFPGLGTVRTRWESIKHASSKEYGIDWKKFRLWKWLLIFLKYVGIIILPAGFLMALPNLIRVDAVKISFFLGLAWLFIVPWIIRFRKGRLRRKYSTE